MHGSLALVLATVWARSTSMKVWSHMHAELHYQAGAIFRDDPGFQGSLLQLGATSPLPGISACIVMLFSCVPMSETPNNFMRK